MSNAEILEKAIAQAVENGWTAELPGGWVLSRPGDSEYAEDEVVLWTAKSDHLLIESAYSSEPWHYAASNFIFDHDFAKAFWGSAPPMAIDPNGLGLRNYQFHLRQQVLSKDPIKYLERGLAEKGKPPTGSTGRLS